VFEARSMTKDKCTRLAEDGCFLRVGSTSTGRGGTATRNARLGDGKDVEIWPSALATYYGVGKEGIKIHKNEASARIGTPFADPNSKTRPLSRSSPRGNIRSPKKSTSCVSR